MTLNKTSGSQPLSDHALLKLSTSANFRTRLVSQGTNLTVVSKSLLQHSRTFESSYGESFAAAHVNDICKETVFLEICRMDSNSHSGVMSI